MLGEKAALWGSLLVATEEARGQLRRRLREPVSSEEEDRGLASWLKTSTSKEEVS